MIGRPNNRSGDTCEWAALAALGVLTPAESAGFEQHLESGCPVCEAELRSFQEVAGQLGAASAGVAPSALLKSRLMARISEGAGPDSPHRSGTPSEPQRVAPTVVRTSTDEEGSGGSGATAIFVWNGWLTAAAVLLVACSGVWMAVQNRSAPHELDYAVQETYIDSLYAQVAPIIRVGLGDHVHCSFFRKFGEDPPTFEKMAQEMGPAWTGLVPLVAEKAPQEFRVVLAHRCAYRRREFVHVTLRSDTKLLSVVITPRREGEGFSRENVTVLLDRLGIEIYGQGVDGFETAGFESSGHLAYVVSDLTTEGNLELAASLAPALRRFLEQTGA